MTRGRLRASLLLLTGLVACAVASVAPGQTRHHTHDHSFQNAEQWARMFDDPRRDATQKPHEVIQALALRPDAVVADIGAGTGYFTVRLAHMLPRGRVFAVDTEPDMVRYLQDRVRREGLQGVRVVQARPDDPRLPEKVDLALIVDVYHHVGQRDAWLKKLKAQLKPGGRVAIIDFRMDAPEGPPTSGRIAPDRVRAEFAAVGFVEAGAHDFLPNQYFLMFKSGS